MTRVAMRMGARIVTFTECGIGCTGAHVDIGGLLSIIGIMGAMYVTGAGVSVGELGGTGLLIM